MREHLEGAPAQPGSGAGGPAANNRPVYGYWAMKFTAEGVCRERRYTYDKAVADAYNFVYESRTAQANELPVLDACPAGAQAVVAPTPPTPGELARDFWDVRHLPRPTLRVVPDGAIVGKRVYLQIGGPPSTTFDVPNPIGAAISIAATSRYVIDWGDGSPPTTTTSQGGPWPHGDVTHVYDTDAAERVIRVTQQWSASWTAGGGAAGTLDSLQTSGELAIRVDELQPVRNR